MVFLRACLILVASIATAIVASDAGADISDGQSTSVDVESLFQQTLEQYRGKGTNPEQRWKCWSEMANILAQVKEDDSKALEVIKVYEEGILLIEEVVFRAGNGEDPQRDAALSNLYMGYGKQLASLTHEACTTLALSPRSLIIGYEKADKNNPSNKLCRENAVNALRNAATLDATNTKASDLLAMLASEEAGPDGVHRRKPKEFVAALFDSFADSFDSKLAALQYKVPGLVGAAATALLVEKGSNAEEQKSLYRSALDAGCGTGLAGRYLRPFVDGQLIGVDASEKMLEIARKCTTVSGCGAEDEEAVNGKRYDINIDTKPLYDGLFALDLEDMTLENTHNADGDSLPFDLVVAADVLVYFGRLDSILHTFASLSSPNAKLIFSSELASEDEAPLGWRLLSSGRFAHTKNHAVEAAAKSGYELVMYDEIVPRMEKGEEVKGHLFCFVLQDKGPRAEGIKNEL